MDLLLICLVMNLNHTVTLWQYGIMLLLLGRCNYLMLINLILILIEDQMYWEIESKPPQDVLSMENGQPEKELDLGTHQWVNHAK